MRKTGKRLITVMILTLAVIVSVTTSCEKKSYEENELEMVRTEGLHFVEVLINNKKGKFLVDTGANLSYINKDKIKYFGLKVNSREPGMGLTGIGGRADETFGVYKFKMFKRDSTELPTNVNFRTTDLSNIGIKIDGIIGNDYLIKNKAVLDYAEEVVTINK